MTATTTRPRSTDVRADADVAGRRPARGVLLSVVTVGVLAGGVWGLAAPRGTAGEPHVAGGSALATVDLPDGTLRVDGLVDKQVGTMPGMDMPEDVPEGMRRFAVDVSLGATEDGALRYDRRSFTVSGPGVKPVVPVDSQLDRGALAPGSTISGSLTFDVPEEATALVLRFRGGAALALPALPAAADGEQAEAPEAPAAGGGDAPGMPPHED